MFETAGAAVYLEGEACSWYESGAAGSVVLKANRFLNCAYIPAWGEAPVTIWPKVESSEEWYYHGRLELLQNEFYCFDERVLYARHIGDILLVDNLYYDTAAYPKREGKRFDIANYGCFSEQYHL